jgi:uncharacterized membrane protein
MTRDFASPFSKLFQQPMVPAEFGYSTRGTLAALAVALAIASLLYALTAWPLQTLGWLAAAGIVHLAGRHPVAALFR